MNRDRNANTAAEPLLTRPLSARSLVASLLLRSRPARMRGARLVQWCGLFGISEGATRTALSRMVERGELRSHDGVYELAGRVQGRRGSQDWSLAPVLESWDGSWRVGIVAPGARPAVDRSAFARRAAAHALRNGARGGVEPARQPPERIGARGGVAGGRRAVPRGGRDVRTAIRSRSRACCSTVGSGSGERWRSRCASGPSRPRWPAHPTARWRALSSRGPPRSRTFAPTRCFRRSWSSMHRPGPRSGASYGAYEDEFSKALRTWFRHHEG